MPAVSRFGSPGLDIQAREDREQPVGPDPESAVEAHPHELRRQDMRGGEMFVEPAVQQMASWRADIAACPHEGRSTSTESQGRRHMVIGPVGIDQVEAALTKVAAEPMDRERKPGTTGSEVEHVQHLEPPASRLEERRASGESGHHDTMAARGEPRGEVDGVLGAGVVPAHRDHLQYAARFAQGLHELPRGSWRSRPAPFERSPVLLGCAAFRRVIRIG
ncbi:MAG: hypothetical protein FD129_1670 [bacterium]|nr:MAG: hypothetical protein FD129_1670 [bacterium]